MNIIYVYPEEILQKNAREISVLNTVAELKKFTRVRLALSNLNCATNEINAKFDLSLAKDDFIVIKKRFLGFKSNKIFNFNLRNLLAREKGAVFYTRHLKTAAYLIAHKMPAQKVVFEGHECFSLQNPAIAELEKTVLSKCDFYVFHNASTMGELAKIYGVEFPKSAVAYNGVKLPEMQDAPKHFKFDEIAYFGSFIAWKGVDLLLELLAKRSNLKLFLYGDDTADSARTLKQKVAESRLESRVKFMGRLSQYEVVQELAKNERILVLPNKKSEYSNFSVPIKIFEYLGTRNLVFAPSFAPFREVMRDGENGFLYEPENMDALASLLETVSQKSEDELNAVANAGRESVKNFTWAARAKAIATALKSAFEGDDNSNLEGEV